MIVGVDAGHGGTNHGCAANNLHEEQLTLITAMAVRDAMLRLDAGVKVLLSREHDETVTFADRALRLAPADFVMSLHYDAAEDPTVGRMGCYCFPDDPIGRQVGEHLLMVAPDPLRPKDPACRLVSRDDWTVRAYNVLQHHRPKPCVLVEVGYLTNLAHVEYLIGPGGMDAIAHVLCTGLTVGLLGVAAALAAAAPAAVT